MRAQVLAVVAVSVAFALAGCAGPDERAGDATGTSPGVETVHVAAVHGADAPTWSSVLEYSTSGVDTLQLGSGESLFARFLGDGSLAIANGPQLVKLNPDGSFARILGRNGDGPGEFRVILPLGVAEGGSLFAVDFPSGRLTQLTATGEVLRIIRRLRPTDPELGVTVFAVLSDGRTLALTWPWRPAREPVPGEPEGTLVRDQVAFVVYDGEGEVSDTIMTLPGLERSGGFVAPFARSAVYSGRGARWAAGTTDSLDFTIYDGLAPRIRLVARRGGAPLTGRQRAQRDSAVAEQLGTAGSRVVDRQARMPRASTAPDIGGVLVDAAGRLWVGAYVVPGDTMRVWSIYSQRGAPLGQVALRAFGEPLVPARTELLDAADGRVAMVRETADGEVFIDVLRVVER